MGDLSRNLSRSEFACKCGCGYDTVDFELVGVIQNVCDYLEATVHITSGCRCPTHNAASGGLANSQHLLGRGADCVFTGFSPLDVNTFLTHSFPDRYGFGVYTVKNFIHIDTRSNGPARWTRPRR